MVLLFLLIGNIMSQLIVNADDFGLHPAVNEAIIKGHREGIISSTSLLASGPAFDQAVSLAGENPSLGIGVHTCLVGGLPPVAPVDQVRSLVTEEGLFPLTYIELMKKMYSGTLNYNEVYIELKAQFDKVCQSGLTITHADGHQHMHMLPKILPIVVALMKDKSLHKIRIPQEAKAFTNGVHNPGRLVGKIGLSYVAAGARKRIEAWHMTAPDHFWGMINGGQLTQDALEPILHRVAQEDGVHEIMTHPGSDNQALGQLFQWGYHWEEEEAAMTSARTRLILEEKGIELINYGDLP